MSVRNGLAELCLGLALRTESPEEKASSSEALARRERALRVGPTPAFRAVARQRMLGAIAADATQPAGARARGRLSQAVGPTWALRTGVALGAATIVALGGGTAAVLAAPPESPLFEARLAAEELRLGLVADPQERVQLRLESTRQRAGELVEAASAPNAPSSAVESARFRYEEAVRAAVREATGSTASLFTLGRVEAELSRQETQLRAAEADLPAGRDAERASLMSAVGLVERERAAVSQRIPSAASARATEVGSTSTDSQANRSPDRDTLRAQDQVGDRDRQQTQARDQNLLQTQDRLQDTLQTQERVQDLLQTQDRVRDTLQSQDRDQDRLQTQDRDGDLLQTQERDRDRLGPADAGTVTVQPAEPERAMVGAPVAAVPTATPVAATPSPTPVPAQAATVSGQVRQQTGAQDATSVSPTAVATSASAGNGPTSGSPQAGSTGATTSGSTSQPSTAPGPSAGQQGGAPAPASPPAITPAPAPAGQPSGSSGPANGSGGSSGSGGGSQAQPTGGRH